MYRLLKFLVATLVCAISMRSLAQDQSRLVIQYGPEEGFTTASVNDILRDSKGLMWFGTTAGLYRFDGYRFDVFKPNDKDSLSLSDVFIRELFEDSRGNIWIGTLHGGLCRFDPKQQVIRRFHDPRDSIGPRSIIHGMAEDKDGNIWIVGLRGIHRYSYESGWSRYRFTEAELPKASRKQPFSIHIAGNGIIWLGCQGRTFMRLDPHTRKVKLYDFNSTPLRSGLGRSITTDEKGIVWMTANEGGLIRFDPAQEKCDILPPEEQQPYWSLSSTPRGIFVGAQNGLLVFNKEDLSYQKPVSNALYDLDGADVRVVYMESDHAVWLGTAGKGLFRVQFVPSLNITSTSESSQLSNVIKDKQLHFYTYPNQDFSIKELAPNQANTSKIHLKHDALITDALRDSKGDSWLVGSGKILHLKPQKSRGPTNYAVSKVHTVMASVLTEDDQHRIWAGGMGYFLLNPTTNAFEDFKKGNGGNVEDMEHTTEGTWAALANNGLAQLIKDSDTVLRHVHDPYDSTTVSDNYVSQLHVDRTGTLWIGTLRGLDRYNPTTKNFTRFQIPLQENAVYRLDEDTKGRLLIQTKGGIVRFTPPFDRAPGHMEKIQSPINLSHGYGFLHYPWFTWQQADQVAECHLDSITPAPTIPPIIITGFTLDPNNKHPLSPELAQSNPAYWSRIELAHDQNLLNIEFSVLDFSDPDKNEYAYQLKGFDTDWTYSGTRRFVTYSNLEPGEYVFRAKGANAYGTWSTKEINLTILIRPPWWKSNAAYLIYGLVLIGVVYAARRSTINRERLKAQVALEQKEKETLQELDHLKSKFYSSITHEFRTPLTLIQGPAHELYNRSPDPESRQLASLIQDNSKRLLKLINQLLDLAKLDAREMKLRPTAVNLSNHIPAIHAQFASIATSRKISYDLDLAEELPVVLVDEPKLEVIVTNLLSNAFKFTPEGGRVTFVAGYREGKLIAQVNDTGRGIPSDQLPKIFDRFYQVSPSDTRYAEGTGIGLALVKEYVELMHGVIRVNSLVGQGSAFEIELPLPVADSASEKPDVIRATSTPDQFQSTLHVNHDNSEAPLILLVEDNADIRAFVKTCLGKDYRFADAIHGQAGLEAARSQVPDLIISDWMMPEMDGMEFCRRIKKDPRTDHIPLILLTAKATHENRLEGLRTGVDDYLVKPFDREELLLKIQNLLTSRDRLQAHLQRSQLTTASPLEAESMEEKFVARARAYVEKNLQMEALSVEELAGEMALSREQFYRKMVALTGLSPSAFIRKLRLQHAAQLLASGSAVVSEAAFQTGFASLSHFSKAFKEEFGVTPSEFRQSRSGKAS